MSDGEHDEVETFEGTDSGAAATYPKAAGSVRKGDYIMIKGDPCKVISLTTSKTGKHGNAKANITALNIWNGNKREDIVPTSHNCTCPFVTRKTYLLMDISDDDYLSLFDEETSETREDIALPANEELKSEIQSGHEEGKQLLLTVMSACGHEQVME